MQVWQSGVVNEGTEVREVTHSKFHMVSYIPKVMYTPDTKSIAAPPILASTSVLWALDIWLMDGGGGAVFSRSENSLSDCAAVW